MDKNKTKTLVFTVKNEVHLTIQNLWVIDLKSLNAVKKRHRKLVLLSTINAKNFILYLDSQHFRNSMSHPLHKISFY